MATNVSMIRALERIEKLIANIKEETKELNAWKEVLHKHIRAQKKQHGRDWNDHYEYNKKTGKCKRVFK